MEARKNVRSARNDPGREPRHENIGVVAFGGLTTAAWLWHDGLTWTTERHMATDNNLNSDELIYLLALLVQQGVLLRTEDEYNVRQVNYNAMVKINAQLDAATTGEVAP
jgi:hypothetical protein